MNIGPITIRWTKDIERERSEDAKAKEQAWIKNKKAKALTNALIHKQTAELVELKAKLHRWGLDEGVVKEPAEAVK